MQDLKEPKDWISRASCFGVFEIFRGAMTIGINLILHRHRNVNHMLGGLHFLLFLDSCDNGQLYLNIDGGCILQVTSDSQTSTFRLVEYCHLSGFCCIGFTFLWAIDLMVSQIS